jgi:hypothetical protein
MYFLYLFSLDTEKYPNHKSPLFSFEGEIPLQRINHYFSYINMNYIERRIKIIMKIQEQLVTPHKNLIDGLPSNICLIIPLF